ncbi:ABC transporter permease [Paenibacillus gansuensis]|uniref:ABC transporter permease n=1 Tax=Paenibacillus gansuensis TaxID=306542 RepID=A0ABW5P7J3_9BACL
MKSYIQLTLAQLRIFIRNRQVLFWSLFFPVFFMIVLGSFLGGGSGASFNGAVLDSDRSEASEALVSSLRQSPLVNELEDMDDQEQALEMLKQGDLQTVIMIPKGYGEQLGRKDPSAPAEITVYYDQTNVTESQLGLTVIQQSIDGVSKSILNYKPVTSLKTEGVQSLNLKYIDFLVPGIVAMMIMNNNLNGVAGQIAAWRERGILRRMQSTTLQSGTFIAAQITARLVLNGLQAVIVLLIGNLAFGTQVNGSWLLLLAFVILGTLAFMSIGFIIAGLAKTPESAGPIAGFISFPMLFLGGVFFPIRSMPDWLQGFVKLLPISHLSTALRQVMNVGAGAAELWGELALLGGWMLAAFIIASFTFKWE